MKKARSKVLIIALQTAWRERKWQHGMFSKAKSEVILLNVCIRNVAKRVITDRYVIPVCIETPRNSILSFFRIGQQETVRIVQ